MKCHWCGREIVLEVLHNHSGWYVGYVCSTCGPLSRETGFYATREEAESSHSTFKEV